MNQVSSCIGALAIVAGALCIAPNPASAGSITAKATIDLATAITGTAWTGYGLPLDAPVTVQNGDTVTIEIGFAGNQKLSWDGNGFFNPWLMLTGYPGGTVDPDQEGWFEWSNLSASFQGLSQGTPFDSAWFTDGMSGLIHLGPTYALYGDGVARSFTGVSVTFTASFSDGDAFRSYSTIGYPDPMFEGVVTWSEAAAAVQEPGGLALLGTALMALGMVQRRRRQV